MQHTSLGVADHWWSLLYVSCRCCLLDYRTWHLRKITCLQSWSRAALFQQPGYPVSTAIGHEIRFRLSANGHITSACTWATYPFLSICSIYVINISAVLICARHENFWKYCYYLAILHTKTILLYICMSLSSPVSCSFSVQLIAILTGSPNCYWRRTSSNVLGQKDHRKASIAVWPCCSKVLRLRIPAESVTLAQLRIFLDTI